MTWKQLGDVGAAIQEHAEKNGFSVVRDLCGQDVYKRQAFQPSDTDAFD